jgi:hypothetical protein
MYYESFVEKICNQFSIIKSAFNPFVGLCSMNFYHTHMNELNMNDDS